MKASLKTTRDKGSIMRLHFKNKPFEAIMRATGEKFEFIPVVFDEENDCCGIALFAGLRCEKCWGVLEPRDLITSWRATEIVRYFNFIGRETLCYAYYSAIRNSRPHERYSQPIIKFIGQETYDGIMAMPIPEKIIRAVLDNQPKLSLYPISQELEAGTIKWDERFSEFGIKHPDDTKEGNDSQKSYA